MSNRAIDVIIPTYNGLPYLKETVESVLGQTHRELALYIIDDGSTDNGATERYAKNLKDKRVRYVRKDNGGQATARNHGIRISDSPYVALVDSDDIWFPDKLERQLQVLEEKSEVGMVYGYHHFIDADGNITGSLVKSNRGHLTDILVEGNSIAGSASMVLVRREVFDKVGLFKEDLLIGEDWEMWLRIAQDYQIDYVPDFIAALRVLDEGMQKNHKKMADGLVYMWPIMMQELKLTRKQGKILTDTCLWGAAELYQAGKMRWQARRTLLKLFHLNPRSVTRPGCWIGVGIYTRIIFGNPVISAANHAARRVLGKKALNDTQA